MINKRAYNILKYCIASVWLVNGFYCKVLNFVPRHEKIVARILGDLYAKPLTILIGFSEIIMAIWIISNYKSKLNTIVQITIIAIMNTLEYTLVPDLLLWGKLNSLFAFLFILVIYFNNIILSKNN